MKLTNAQMQQAIESLGILCNDPNRLPTLAASRAGRALGALQAVYAPADKVRTQIIRDHGEDMGDNGKRLLPGGPGWDEFVTLMAEEHEINVDPIRATDVEAGWTRTPEGKREPGLDISPAHLAVLEELGLIVRETDEKAA